MTPYYGNENLVLSSPSPSSQHAHPYCMHACLFPGCLAHYIEVDVFQCDVSPLFSPWYRIYLFLVQLSCFYGAKMCLFLFAQSSKYLSVSISKLSHENPWEHSTTLMHMLRWFHSIPGDGPVRTAGSAVPRAAGPQSWASPLRNFWPLFFWTARLHLFRLFPCCGGAHPP